MPKKLTILTHPDPILTVVSQPVESFDEELWKLRKDMLHTMYKNHGIGLAAIQVGVSKRMCVIDVSPQQSNPITLINPEIIKTSGEALLSEGCLSLPGTTKAIKRHAEITVKFYDKKGQCKTLTAGGLLAACIQHEMDHMDGILLLDKD
jgi:peptide deformylase